MGKMIFKDIAMLLLMITINGCNTFFEEDITQKTVGILSPSSGTESEVASQTFWWKKVDGASHYHLQIVTPSFDSIQVLILDTIVSSDKFMMVLYPSVYEWRVRAENSAWQSQWTSTTLKIYSTNDLTRQKINLRAPGSLSNKSKNLFRWEGLYNADHYAIVAYKDQWEGILAISYTNVDTTNFETNLNDGMYIWGVKAINSTSETLYTQKSLMVDTSSPEVPDLLAPSDKSISSALKVSFSWNSSDMMSGLAQDTLKIYSDKELTKKVKVVVSNSKSVEITFTERSAYYWTVSSVDKAGNHSETASPFNFVIR